MRVLIISSLVLFVVTAAQARNNIRQSFFNVYPNATNTWLDNLPSKTTHCGVCHYDFNGGGPRNPYGIALGLQGGLNTETGRTNAIKNISTDDQDHDGFTTQIEITAIGYSNTPTFPGLQLTNVNAVVSISNSLVTPYLTPTTTVDITRPVVTVQFPNGGEVLTANRATNITWIATDNIGVTAIQIHESLNNGTTYAPLAAGLANTGSFAYFPANRPTTTARIKVIAVDAAGNSSNDISNAAFTIISPPGGTVPTTLRDFDMPGTQPFQGGAEFASPQNCATCHGDYSPAVEPYRNWQGSMMAHAARDPLFEANMAIANQDAPDSGDLCLRCHLPNGWLQGRSVPTDGSRMMPGDRHGISCELCHRMVDPVYKPGISPAVDINILAALTFPGTNYGNGMYVIDPNSLMRGPYSNAAAPHAFQASAFHRSSAFCGTCHDVSNPAFTKDAGGLYQPNSFNTTAGVYSAHSLAPVERTYSEWVASAYNPGTTCQACHMQPVTGYGCNTNINTDPVVPLRTDLPLHDMTGGSTWIPGLLTNLYPTEVSAPAIAAGIQRATIMLQSAAAVTAMFTGGYFKVTVTNETGHKLPTGYPEGRRVWLNVKFHDAGNNLLSESGAYDPNTGVLTHDAEAKIYAVHPGIDTNIAEVVGLPAGPSLHFVLNNKIYEDNRIPPRGFSNAAFAAFGGAPVGYSYADGQYWDDTTYTIPPGTRRAEARLYYQSTTKEFIEFLRDNNYTNTKGQEMYDLWNDNGKCPPTLMAQAVLEPAAPDFAGLQSVTPGIESATLTWLPAGSACVVTYDVLQNGTVVMSTNALSVTVALDPGTTNALTYSFMVRARDNCGGTEANATELSVQPLLDPAKDQDGDGFNNAQESVAGTSAFAAGEYPRIHSVTPDGGSFRIRFATVTGRQYQVKWRATLTSGAWENVGGSVNGDGTLKEVVDTPPAGTPARFYRLVITQP